MKSEKAEMATLQHCAVRGMLVGGSAAGTAIACAAVVAQGHRRSFIFRHALVQDPCTCLRAVR
jgi:hypothetical protein